MTLSRLQGVTVVVHNRYRYRLSPIWSVSVLFFCATFLESPNPQIRNNVFGAPRQAVGGGRRARHRHREDVRPLTAGAPETTGSHFFCLSG
jgi:hypothetical protein